MKGYQFTEEERREIFTLFNSGISMATLAEKYRVTRMSIWRTIQKCRKSSFGHSGFNGRRRMINNEIKLTIEKSLSEEPMRSLRKVSEKVLNDTNKKISHMTIKRYFNNQDIKSFSPIKKPFLKPIHIEQRLKISKQIYFNWLSSYKKIMFTDESKFNLYQSDGKVKVWRKRGEGYKGKNLMRTVKFGGGSVMVWGCFNYNGVGSIKIIENKLNALGYIEILRDELKPSAEKLTGNEYILLQDNDPKHTAKLTKEYIQNQNIIQIPWPSQSPDLNPIENLWDYVKTEIKKYNVRTIAELKTTIIHVWHQIPIELCQKLALSFKKRIYECILKNGQSLKY